MATATAANGQTFTYSGNPDFRGYVAANAPQYLPFVGNDGGINSAALKAATTDNAGNSVISSGVGDYNGATGKIQNLVNTFNGFGGVAAPSGDSGGGAIAGQAQSALTTALSALQASNAQVEAQKSQQNNVLNSNQATQANTYGNTLTKNAQDFETAATGAKTQGNTDLMSLQRLIGSMGGGGSSVETEEVPQLVDRSVAGNISGANTTKATNDQSADTAWNTFLNQLQTQRDQLNDQASEEEATNAGNYNKSAQVLNAIIAAAKGGTVSPSDLDYELNSAVSAIPSVTNWTPSFSGTTPVYQTPALSNFTLTPGQISADAGATLPTTSAGAIPYLASLTQQKQQTTPALATA